MLYFVSERQIDGQAFGSLSREDLHIYPSHNKFLLPYKLIEQVQAAVQALDGNNTDNLLNEMEYYVGAKSHSSLTSCSGQSLNSSQSSNSATCSFSHRSLSHQHGLKTKKAIAATKLFSLPIFSPDVKQSITKDAFYTSTQWNRLIKEACLALCSYCWEHDKPITNEDKRLLVKMFPLIVLVIQETKRSQRY